METHSMIFVTIGNLSFSVQSLFRWPSLGADRPAPHQTRDLSGLTLRGKAGPSSHRGCCPARANCEAKCYLIRGPSISHVTTGMRDHRFRWSCDRFLAQLFFGPYPVLDIFSVFAAALKIQFMSPASDLLSC